MSLLRLNPETGLLEPSKVYFPVKPPIKTVFCLEILAVLGLIELEREPSPSRRIKSSTNLTLIKCALVFALYNGLS